MSLLANALKSDDLREVKGGTKCGGIENSRRNGLRSKKETPV